MVQQEGTMTIAHDFKHIDRVRNWALVIADAERFPNLEIVEVTALLHDIGLSHLNEGDERKEHGPLGAEIAKTYLRANSSLSAEQIDQIADAVYYHSLHPEAVLEHLQALGEKGKLLEIVRDADNMDALGAIGLMRAFTSKYFLPDYIPASIKGNNWGLTSGFQPVNNIMDQINQQLRYYDNLHTITAKNLGQPLVEYMKDFVMQLEYEIDYGKIP